MKPKSTALQIFAHQNLSLQGWSVLNDNPRLVTFLWALKAVLWHIGGVGDGPGYLKRLLKHILSCISQE